MSPECRSAGEDIVWCAGCGIYVYERVCVCMSVSVREGGLVGRGGEEEEICDVIIGCNHSSPIIAEHVYTLYQVS